MIDQRLPTFGFLARVVTTTMMIGVGGLSFSISAEDPTAKNAVDAGQKISVAETDKASETLDPGDPADALIKSHTDGFFTLLKRFDGPIGLRGYLLTSETSQPVVIYTDQQGRYIFIGAVIDESGKNIAAPYLATYLEEEMLPSLFARMDQSVGYVEEGTEGKPLIYVMFDPRCPHCADLYSKLRSYVEAGSLRVRWVPVDVLEDEPMAAQVLDANEDGKGLSMIAGFFSAGYGDNDSTSTQQTSTTSEESRAAAENNSEMFSLLGLAGTPQILFRARSGSYQIVRGSPSQEELDLVIGSASASITD